MCPKASCSKEPGTRNDGQWLFKLRASSQYLCAFCPQRSDDSFFSEDSKRTAGPPLSRQGNSTGNIPAFPSPSTSTLLPICHHLPPPSPNNPPWRFSSNRGCRPWIGATKGAKPLMCLLQRLVMFEESAAPDPRVSGKPEVTVRVVEPGVPPTSSARSPISPQQNR